MRLSDYVCLAEGVDFYCVSPVTCGSYATISQRAFICTASHDTSKLSRPLIQSPVRIEEHAWVCAEAYVGAGVEIGEGAVVGARSVVTKRVDPWVIVAGNPAKILRKRVITP